MNVTETLSGDALGVAGAEAVEVGSTLPVDGADSFVTIGGESCAR